MHQLHIPTRQCDWSISAGAWVCSTTAPQTAPPSHSKQILMSSQHVSHSVELQHYIPSPVIWNARQSTSKFALS